MGIWESFKISLWVIILLSWPYQNIQNMGNHGNRTKIFPYSNQILWESNQQQIWVTHQNRTSTSSNHRISGILCNFLAGYLTGCYGK